MKNLLGFTLIEFMLAMTLGLSLLITASSLLAKSIQGAHLQRGLAEIHETSEFLEQFIRHEFYMAGFQGENQVGIDPIAWETIIWNENEQINETVTTTSDGNKYDKVAIRRIATANDYDCSGSLLETGQSYVSIFYVKKDERSQPVFYCDRIINEKAISAVGLVDNVDRFQVQYEVEYQENGVLKTEFKTKTEINKITIAKKIISVKLGLLFSDTGDPSLPLQDQSWEVLDKTYDTTTKQDAELKNGHFHRVIEWVIPFKNISRQRALPGSL